MARCEGLNGPGGHRLATRAAALVPLGPRPLKHEVLVVFAPSVDEGFAMPAGHAMLDVILPARARGRILAALKGTRTAHGSPGYMYWTAPRATGRPASAAAVAPNAAGGCAALA